MLQDKLAQIEDVGELGREALLHRGDLLGGHAVFGELEDLLAEQLEDLHVVAAESLVRLARLHNLWDKVLPIVRPFVLENLHEDQIQFAELSLGPLKRRLVARVPARFQASKVS